MNFKDSFSDKDWGKLAELAKYVGMGEVYDRAGHPDFARLEEELKEVSGDDNIGRNPVFTEASIDKIGGSVFRFLLDSLLQLCSQVERQKELINYLKEKDSASHRENIDAAIQVHKVKEAIESDNTKDAVNIIGKLLHNKDDPLIL